MKEPSKTSERIKVQILDIDSQEWHWMGWLDKDSLYKLSVYADNLSDNLEVKLKLGES